MRLLGNIIWFVFGGIFMGLMWWLIGLLCILTIVLIPWAKACFVIGQFTFFPFGNEVVKRPQQDIGTGALGTLGNILWFIVAGIWLAIGHLASAVFCFCTIIGIPFGIQHLKLAVVSIAPIGQTVVPIQD